MCILLFLHFLLCVIVFCVTFSSAYICVPTCLFIVYEQVTGPITDANVGHEQRQRRLIKQVAGNPFWGIYHCNWQRERLLEIQRERRRRRKSRRQETTGREHLLINYRRLKPSAGHRNRILEYHRWEILEHGQRSLNLLNLASLNSTALLQNEIPQQREHRYKVFEIITQSHRLNNENEGSVYKLFEEMCAETNQGRRHRLEVLWWK